MSRWRGSRWCASHNALELLKGMSICWCRAWRLLTHPSGHTPPICGERAPDMAAAMDSIVITGVGMATSLGGAVQGAAAARARIARPSPLAAILVFDEDL